MASVDRYAGIPTGLAFRRRCPRLGSSALNEPATWLLAGFRMTRNRSLQPHPPQPATANNCGSSLPARHALVENGAVVRFVGVGILLAMHRLSGNGPGNLINFKWSYL